MNFGKGAIDFLIGTAKGIAEQPVDILMYGLGGIGCLISKVTGDTPECLDYAESKFDETNQYFKDWSKNPYKPFEDIGQQASDTYEKKGAAYSAGFIAPMVVMALRGGETDGKVITNYHKIESLERATKAGEKIVGTEHSVIKPTQEIVNRDMVDSYKEKLLNGEKIEPIEVYEIDGKGHYLQEGHHIYVASVETGIPVEKIYLPHSGPSGMPNWKYVEWKEYISEEQFWED